MVIFYFCLTIFWREKNLSFSLTFIFIESEFFVGRRRRRRRRGGIQPSEFFFPHLHELGRDDVVAGGRLLHVRIGRFHFLAGLDTFAGTLKFILCRIFDQKE